MVDGPKRNLFSWIVSLLHDPHFHQPLEPIADPPNAKPGQIHFLDEPIGHLVPDEPTILLSRRLLQAEEKGSKNLGFLPAYRQGERLELPYVLLIARSDLLGRNHRSSTVQPDGG
jgi:hypothetical protein